MVIIIIFAFKCSPFCKMKGVFVCNILFVKILCRILIFGSNPPASASENYVALLDNSNGAIFFDLIQMLIISKIKEGVS